MKNLRTVALCVSISLSSLCAVAQTGVVPVNEPDYNKPALFSSLPDQIRLDMTTVTNLFNSGVGSVVDVNLSQATFFRFAGQIVSSVSKYDNKILSVVVRSSNYPGALLSISKITAEDGNTTYSGRIVSMAHGDLFELKNIDNQFTLVKKRFYDLVNE
jgi:hypothetical protein